MEVPGCLVIPLHHSLMWKRSTILHNNLIKPLNAAVQSQAYKNFRSTTEVRGKHRVGEAGILLFCSLFFYKAEQLGTVFFYSTQSKTFCSLLLGYKG